MGGLRSATSHVRAQTYDRATNIVLPIERSLRNLVTASSWMAGSVEWTPMTICGSSSSCTQHPFSSSHVLVLSSSSPDSFVPVGGATLHPRHRRPLLLQPCRHHQPTHIIKRMSTSILFIHPSQRLPVDSSYFPHAKSTQKASGLPCGGVGSCGLL